MLERQIIYIVCCIALLGACSPAPDNTPKIAEDARNVLEKTKTVDATVQQNTQETQSKIDAESQ